MNVHALIIGNNEIIVSGNINLVFTCSANSMTSIQTKTLDIPYETKLPANGINSNANVKIKTDILLEDFNIMPGGEVNIRLDIGFNAYTSNDVNLNLINNIHLLKQNSSLQQWIMLLEKMRLYN